MKSFNEHLDQSRRYEQEIEQFQYASRETHRVVELGSVDNNVIYLFEAKESDGTLVTSGWQGDEPAGWEAAKRLINKHPRTSFVPFVSPACFKTRQHLDDYGRNIDRDWPEAVTPEGKILKNNIKRLAKLGEKCMVSLQEDQKRFISYYFGWKTTPEVDEAIEMTIRNHFPLSENMKHAPLKGMFCEFAVGSGMSMAVQLETPADGSYNLALRTDCLVSACSKILRLVTA